MTYLVKSAPAGDHQLPCPLGPPGYVQFRFYPRQSVLLTHPAHYETIHLHYRQAFPSPFDAQFSVFVPVSPV